MTKPNATQRSSGDQALDLASNILNALDEQDYDTNIAQAALGTAWVGLVKAMGWNKEKCLEVMEEIAELQWGEDE